MARIRLTARFADLTNSGYSAQTLKSVFITIKIKIFCTAQHKYIHIWNNCPCYLVASRATNVELTSQLDLAQKLVVGVQKCKFLLLHKNYGMAHDWLFVGFGSWDITNASLILSRVYFCVELKTTYPSLIARTLSYLQNSFTSSTIF